VPVTPAPYGMLAQFETADDLIAACERARRSGLRRVEAYSPYPLPEAAEALGHRRSGVPGLVFSGGLIGGIAAFLMLYWTSAVDYPLNVGGRPLNSWPAFIPITFELTILTASLAALLAVLLLNGLPRFHHPLFASELFARSTSDRFYLCVEAADPRYDPDAIRDLLVGLGPVRVEEVAS
jgi:hypothetical protein